MAAVAIVVFAACGAKSNEPASTTSPSVSPTSKITLPGPFTMTQQAKNEFYKDEEALAMDYAAAINAEARDLNWAAAIQFIQNFIATSRS